GRQGAWRTVGASNYLRHVDVDREVEEMGRLFQRGRAMRYHDAGEVRVLLGERFDLQDQGFPLQKEDVRARNRLKANRDDVCHLVDLWKARDNLVHMQHGLVGPVVEEVQRSLPYGCNSPARADHGNLWLGHSTSSRSGAGGETTRRLWRGAASHRVRQPSRLTPIVSAKAP